MSNKSQSVYRLLNRLRAKLILNLITESARLLAVYFGFVVFVIVPFKYLSGLGLKSTAVFCAVCAGILIFALVKFVVMKFIKIITLYKTARWVESKYPFFQGDLISAFEFENDPLRFDRLGFSKCLIREHIDKIKQSADIKTILNSGSFYPRPQPGRFFVYFIAAMVFPVLIFSDFYANAYYDLYSSYFQPVKPVQEILAVRPGSAKTVFGSDIEIKAVTFTNSDATPDIFVRKVNQQWDKFAMRKISSALYTYQMKEIKEDREYYVQLNQLISPVYKVTSVIIPVILNHRISYIYPAYTGLKPKSELRQQFDDITAIKSTRIKIEIFTNNNIGVASFNMGNDIIPFVTNSTDYAYTEIKTDTETTYTIKIKDTSGQENEPIKPFKIIPVEDKPPAVSISSPAPNCEIPQNMSVTILYHASDDISLENAWLVFNISSGEEKTTALISGIGKKEITETYEWDLASLQLAPGDEINYKIKVSDNFPEPEGPHYSQSQTHRLVLPSMSELYKRKTEVFDQPQQNMESLTNAHDSLISRIKKMEEKLSYANQLSWADKKSIQDAISEQLQIQQSVQQMAQNLKQKVIEQNISADILKNYTELKDIMDSLMTEEMKQALKDIQRMLDESESFQNLKNKLELSAKDMNEYNENLKRALSLFKKLSIQNRLTELLEATRAAISEQEKLNKTMENSIKPEDKPDQPNDVINKHLNEIDRFLKYMEDSQKQLESFDFDTTDQKKQIEELGQTYDKSQMRDILNIMKQKIAQNNLRQALESGTRMRMSMQDFAGAVENLLNNFKSAGIDINKLVDIINRIIRVSDETLALLQSMETQNVRNTDKNTAHAKTMYYIERELNRIGENAKLLAKQSAIINTGYYSPLFEISKTMEKHNENVFKRGDPAAPLVIRNELGNMRLLAVKWVSLLEALNRSGQKGESGNANMPADMDEFFDQLKQMAQKQSSINEQTAMLPNIMPGSSQMSIQQYLSQLAAQQKMLAQALSELNQKYSSSAERILGDLNNVVAQMQKSAQSIEQNDISPDLINRQKKILTRLLESEKSMRTREKSEQRESKSGILNQIPVSPEELDKNLFRQKSDKITRQTDKSYVPPEYRDLVDKYFKQLITGD